MVPLLTLFLVIQAYILKIPNFYDEIVKFSVLSVLAYIVYGLLVYKIVKAKNTKAVLVFVATVVLWIFYLNKTPILSNDVYRYFWDGWLVKSGLNPYVYVPSDWNLKFFQNSALYQVLNWKDQFTPYPPMAQYIFALNYPIYANLGVAAGKIIFVLPVVLLAFLIYKLMGKKWFLIFCLNPFLITEIFYSAHLDGFVMFFLFVSLYSYFKKHFSVSSVFLSFAFLTKIYPGFFLPFLLLDLLKNKKIGEAVKYAVTFFVPAVLFYLPFIQNNFDAITYYFLLPNVQEFNAGFYRYLYQLLGHFTPLGKQLVIKIDFWVFVLSLIYLLTRKLNLKLLIMVGLVYLLFSPVVFPWHTLFLVPLVFLIVQKENDLKALYFLILMQTLLTLTYFEPGRPDIRDFMLNVEYFTLFLILLGYNRFKLPKLFKKVAIKAAFVKNYSRSK